MRILSRLSIVILFVVVLSACNLESNTPNPEVEAVATDSPPTAAGPTEVRPTITSIPSPTVPPTPIPPTATPVVINGCRIPEGWIRYIVAAGDTLYRVADKHGTTIDVLVEGNCLANANQIALGQTLYAPNPNPPEVEDVTIDECGGQSLAECRFAQSDHTDDMAVILILPSDNGVNGHPVGCMDSAIHSPREMPPTGTLAGNIRAMLETLLVMDQAGAGQGRANVLYDQELFVRDVRIENEMVVIDLGGTLQSVGVCGDAAMEAQLVLTAFYYPQVKSARIMVNGKNLRQIFDATGLIGADAIYSAADVKWQWDWEPSP